MTQRLRPLRILPRCVFDIPSLFARSEIVYCLSARISRMVSFPGGKMIKELQDGCNVIRKREKNVLLVVLVEDSPSSPERAERILVVGKA